MRSLLLLICAVAFVFAGPIKTVPWNGHKGAVSFTFDDGLASHVGTLKAMLSTMPDIKVTLFISYTSAHFQMFPFDFFDMAHNGHEIGSHSRNHLYLLDYENKPDFLQTEIVNFADELETLDSSLKITTFASPFCLTSDIVRQYIKKRFFLNRDCVEHGRNDWNIPAQWFSMPSMIWDSELLSQKDIELVLDSAVMDNGWQVMLFHDINDDSNSMSIAPETLNHIFAYAQKNQMWISTFSTIGAYYRAHFVLDSAKAKPTEGGYYVSWKLPSEHLPESVKVRVRVNSDSIKGTAVVEQKGNVIFPEPDGSFVIEFCSRELNVRSMHPSDSAKASIKKPELSPSVQRFDEIFNLKGVRQNKSSLRPGAYVRKGYAKQAKMLLVKGVSKN